MHGRCVRSRHHWWRADKDEHVRKEKYIDTELDFDLLHRSTIENATKRLLHMICVFYGTGFV